MINLLIIMLAINVIAINIIFAIYMLKHFKFQKDEDKRICRNCKHCISGRNYMGEMYRRCIYYSTVNNEVKGSDTCGHFEFAEELVDYKLRTGLEETYRK